MFLVEDLGHDEVEEPLLLPHEDRPVGFVSVSTISCLKGQRKRFHYRIYIKRARV